MRRVPLARRPASARPLVALALVAVCAPPAGAGQSRLRAAPVATPPRVWVTNSTTHTVSAVDAASGTVVATVAVGTAPALLALAPGGARAYVPNTGSDGVSVVDTAAESVVATVAVSDGPSIVAVTPDAARVYVGCANGIVDVIDAASSSVVATIAAGAPAQGYSIAGLAVAPDGQRAYALWGDLVEIDVATNAIVRRVYAGNNTTGLALSPDGSRAYVCAAFGYGAFGFQGTVAVVDTAALVVTNVINTWSLPTTISVSPDGTRAYVATPSTFVNTGYGAGYLPSPWVARLDLVANALAGGVNVGAPARGLDWSPDGTRVFVAVPNAHALVSIDAAANALAGSVVLGGSPNGVDVRD